MAKITYKNKQTLNANPSIQSVNKVESNDMNEIKRVVNENDTNVGDLSNLNTTDKTSVINAINEVNTNQINSSTYSINEIVIGTYLGKPLYRKVINTGTLNLSTSELLLDTGITNVDKVRTIEIMMYYTSGSIWYKNWNIKELAYKKQNNKISLVGSKSVTFSDSYITIEYTKTTD